jgi:hypothetical protein
MNSQYENDLNRQDPRPKTKIFTPQAASKMIPLLEAITKDIRVGWKIIIEKRAEIKILEELAQAKSEVRSETEEIERIKQELRKLVDQMNQYIEEVENLGCFVEEFKRGVINFPALYHGRKVFLCWRYGEKEVKYWHELDEGYGDRKKIRNPKIFYYEKRGES